MISKLRVALNMSSMPVRQKVLKARLVSGCIADNPGIFTGVAALLAGLNVAADALEAAQQAASDGGKTLTAVMHHKESELINTMRQVAAYVEKIARQDEGVVKLAGLNVKQSTANGPRPDFEAEQDRDILRVRLRTRAQPHTFYRWQYSSDTGEPQNWVTALTSHVCSVVIGSPAPGSYWFRVVLVSVTGEHPMPALRVAVN